MISVMSETLPRFEIYRQLQADLSLQTALLNVFTDVVEFSVKVYDYFKQSSLGKWLHDNQTHYLIIYRF